jgi:ribosome maturation factor RimP
MNQPGALERLIEPAIIGLGYELVRVQVKGGRRTTVQIMAERGDRRAMKVEDCVRLSREISTLLEAADPIAEDYDLEVSSPGIDRPLMKREDYERFIGHEAKLEIEPPIEGRKRFQGTIASVEGEDVRFEVQNGAVMLPFASIQRAKLVLTDRLIAAALKEEAAADHQPAEDAA